MRTITICMECFNEFGHHNSEISYMPYYEDRVAIHTCSHGHKNALVLQSQKFEVLLESGAEALLKGFTLEACVTFYAALERTYEFAIRVYFAAKGIDGKPFKDMFKEMSRLSERQIGAFMALYLLDTGKAYEFDQNLTTTRNGYIHKGEIPTPEEAHVFCSKIYGRIFELIEVLRSAHPESITRVISMDMSDRQAKLDPTINVASSTGTTFFNLANHSNNPDFGQNLQDFHVRLQEMFGE